MGVSNYKLITDKMQLVSLASHLAYYCQTTGNWRCKVVIYTVKAATSNFVMVFGSVHLEFASFASEQSWTY